MSHRPEHFPANSDNEKAEKKKLSTKHKFIASSAAAALALGLAGCGDDNSQELPPSPTTISAEPTTPTPTDTETALVQPPERIDDPAAEYRLHEYNIEHEPDLNLDSPNYKEEALISSKNDYTIGEVHYLASILPNDQEWGTQEIMDAMIQATPEEIERTREVLSSYDPDDDIEMIDLFKKYGFDEDFSYMPYDENMPIGDKNDITRLEFEEIANGVWAKDNRELRDHISALEGDDLGVAYNWLKGQASVLDLVGVLEKNGVEMQPYDVQ